MDERPLGDADEHDAAATQTTLFDDARVGVEHRHPSRGRPDSVESVTPQELRLRIRDLSALVRDDDQDRVDHRRRAAARRSRRRLELADADERDLLLDRRTKLQLVP